MPDGDYQPLSFNAQMAAILARHDAIFEHLEAQDRTLDKILAQTTAHNGRMYKAEVRLDRIEEHQVTASHEREAIQITQENQSITLQALKTSIKRAVWTAAGIWGAGGAVIWLIEKGFLAVRVPVGN